MLQYDWLVRFQYQFINVNGCWEWTGCIDRGYGVAYHGGKRWKAHRLSYFLSLGVNPENLCVLHECDNPICINPEHLFLGTQLDNIQDMNLKNRNANTRFTREEILEIQIKYGTGNFTQRELAKQYSVAQCTIWEAINMK